jgi:hypothetical protein
MRRVQGTVINIRFLTDCERRHPKARSSYTQMQETRENNNATINHLS